MKKIIFGLLTIFIGVIAVSVSKQNVPLVTTNQKPSLAVYCSSSGQLTNNKLIQSHHSYCMRSDSSTKKFTANTPNTYSFSIIDDEGSVIKNFAVTHTKPMHVIIARKDLAYFQHVHPVFDNDTGLFSFTDLKFPADGEYRIFADFAVREEVKYPLVTTISEDIIVGTGADYTKQDIGSEERTKNFGNMNVSLQIKPSKTVSGSETLLTYNLNEFKQTNKPITDLQTYLGALGHAVVLSEGTLDFIHAHPIEDLTKQQTGKVSFIVDFPKPGKYKVFTQFQRGGEVITTDFVVTVSAGSENKSTMEMTHEINH